MSETSSTTPGEASTTDPAVSLAQACAEAMHAGDKVAHHLEIAVEGVGPGTATVSMTVGEAMLNGHGTCHGGIIFTLADTAFAYACNSYNRVTVAQHCTVTFVAPARHGDRLTACALERNLAGRNGIYDVRVTNQESRTIAEFRGNSFSTVEPLVVESGASPDGS